MKIMLFLFTLFFPMIMLILYGVSAISLTQWQVIVLWIALVSLPIGLSIMQFSFLLGFDSILSYILCGISFVFSIIIVLSLFIIKLNLFFSQCSV